MKESEILRGVGIIVFSIMLLGTAWLVTAPHSRKEDHYKNYQWAVQFCDGEKNIRRFESHNTLPDKVQCLDGRFVDIPNNAKLNNTKR